MLARSASGEKLPIRTRNPSRSPNRQSSGGKHRKQADVHSTDASIKGSGRIGGLQRSRRPSGYSQVLGQIKARIQKERLRAVFTVNAAMVLLYWDIGQMILERQQRAGWGARVIDRLANDLRDAYPDMKGFSPRNLKYMRAFSAAWPDRAIVQEPLAQITWYHNIALLEKVATKADRLWYARQAVEHGWSHSMLVLQIEGLAHQRCGKTVHNFNSTLPPVDSDMAAHIFKDPYVFDFLGTADLCRYRAQGCSVCAGIRWPDERVPFSYR